VNHTKNVKRAAIPKETRFMIVKLKLWT